MTGALDAAVFARLMARFEPFEPAPVLAVGVSGGADSLALALLAVAWARARGGRIHALTVDHGLRPDSAAEARQVGVWLDARGIAHEILSWDGPKPGSGVQAAAREARRRLLGDWCRARGVLHLLLAHHQGDQAETLAIRREDRSGPDGLAAMAAETETGWGRLLRPLLGQPKPTLAAVLAAAGQDWIEDPSNRDERHARVRHRRRIADAASEATLAGDARAHGAARSERGQRVAAVLAAHVRLQAAGWASLDTTLVDHPDVIARTALARVIVAVGNLGYAPRGERLDRLLDHLRAGGGRARTLGGCRIARHREGWIVAREGVSLPPDGPFIGGIAAWDRFVVTLPIGVPAAGLSLGALRTARPPGIETVPGAARPALAAIRDLDGVLAVPHLRWVRPGADRKLEGATAWTFPRQGLAGAGFAVT